MLGVQSLYLLVQTCHMGKFSDESSIVRCVVNDRREVHIPHGQIVECSRGYHLQISITKTMSTSHFLNCTFSFPLLVSQLLPLKKQRKCTRD